MKKQLLIITSLMLSACASTTQINPDAKGIPLMFSDPAPNCEEVGGIDVGGIGCGFVPFVSYPTNEGLKNCMRNRALEMGANYVRYETRVSATAYKCTNK